MNWIDHVKQFRKENTNLSFKEALSQAKTSYVKNDVKKSVPKTPRTSGNISLKEAKDFIKKNNLNYLSVLKDSKKYQMED